jgi:ATP-binding cassette subfamily C (CFTR/MRP) protein 1
MLDVFNDLWLSVWSSAAKGSNSFVSQLAANFFSSIRPPAGASSSEYLVIYAYFGLSSVAVLMLVSALTAQIGLSGSSALHDKMVSSLLRSPMSFFDTTPVGRILNRCSRDMESLDQSLTVQLLDMGLLGAMLLVNLLAVCIISPLFLICLAPVTVLFWRIQVAHTLLVHFAFIHPFIHNF